MADLDWWNYHGEALCPRCGVGAETGDRYKVCAEYPEVDDGGYRITWTDGMETAYSLDGLTPHEMACERYNYGDLCQGCELDVRQSESPSASVGSGEEA